METVSQSVEIVETVETAETVETIETVETVETDPSGAVWQHFGGKIVPAFKTDPVICTLK